MRWGTYRQIQARGGQVRKGERGTRILSFQDHRRIALTDERGRPARDNEGKRVYRYKRLPTPVVRQYTVFNAEQADGLPARPTPTTEPLWKVHQNAERVLLEDGGVPVCHVAGDRAFYNLNRDEIILPERVQFPSANSEGAVRDKLKWAIPIPSVCVQERVGSCSPNVRRRPSRPWRNRCGTAATIRRRWRIS